MSLGHDFETKEYGRRNKILGQKGITYREYLKSPLWKQAKERLVKLRGVRECRICKSTKNIEVHHNNYNERNLSGRIRALVTLCGDCHETIHKIAKIKNWPYHKIMRMLVMRHKKYGDKLGYAKGDLWFPKMVELLKKKK